MTETPRWRAVLFDLDGTLADTVELILHCYRHTMRVHLGREPPDERWLATIGRRLEDQFEDFARSDDEAEAMLETYVRHQRTVHDEMVRAFPGADRIVDGLLAAEVPVGVVTSKRREMALRTLEACGLEGSFGVVVAGDDVERGKPDPEGVRKALAGLGVDAAASVVFVGDSPYDIRAGREAGIRTAGALWGPYRRDALENAGPDYLLKDIEELASLLP